MLKFVDKTISKCPPNPPKNSAQNRSGVSLQNIEINMKGHDINMKELEAIIWDISYWEEWEPPGGFSDKSEMTESFRDLACDDP